MAELHEPDPDPAGVLRLVRRDRAAAQKQVGSLTLEQQVALVCSAPVRQRQELLELLPEPERAIELLPEAEFCFTVKALGLESAPWILEHATPNQVAAAIDLDAWSEHALVGAKLGAWLDALAESEDEALLRSLSNIDSELLVLWLRDRIAVFIKPSDDEGWTPPDGSQTLEGQFYFVSLRTGDDVATIQRLLQALFRADYWTYFRLMQGVIHELPTEVEEWALRWRNARLQDLGFPSWENAMRLYQYLSPKERATLPPGENPLDVAAWDLPVWMPSLPEAGAEGRTVFRAIARLEETERRAAFFSFAAIANAVAVADHMELSDSETTPRAIEKAARWIDRGLAHLAAEHGLTDEEVLRRVSFQHLFRLGANLDPERARPRRTPEAPGA
ncbi:MAG: DUF6178 family protein [Myxococcota bacterium]|jgi:hypothetical protein|nr:hypothetical protein [Deltaproteobacteria bacterium]MCP4242851.1 hypothetical protein [bacterium]MDP6075692.1 DUF6178 family protein [Myxococcota bacterium]MDP6243471.1 DUF6178 family protein [Myxococcota bacterium]MDP7075436.1 DUF6178 family protein [Myxococcota bacterium]